MPILYELVEEYYVPEFSEKSIGNIKLSIEKNKKGNRKMDLTYPFCYMYRYTSYNIINNM